MFKPDALNEDLVNKNSIRVCELPNCHRLQSRVAGKILAQSQAELTVQSPYQDAKERTELPSNGLNEGTPSRLRNETSQLNGPKGHTRDLRP